MRLVGAGAGLALTSLLLTCRLVGSAWASERSPSEWGESRGPSDSRPASIDPADFRAEPLLRSLAAGTGEKGLGFADVTDDGIPEVFAGQEGSWQVLRLVPGEQRIEVLYRKQIALRPWGEAQGLLQLQVADVDDDGEAEVLLLLAEGAIEVRDARTGDLEGRMEVPLTPIVAADNMLVPAQVIPGGPVEFVLMDWDGLRVFEYLDPFPIASAATEPGSDLAVGQVDGDPGLEVCLNESQSRGDVVVYDAATLRELRRLDLEAGWIALTDIDEDGRDELVTSGRSRPPLRAYDLDTMGLIWSLRYYDGARDGDPTQFLDADGDGELEFLLGGPDVRGVALFDARTGAPEYYQDLFFLSSGDQRVALADFDGDCDLEYFVTGHSGPYTDDLALLLSFENGEVEALQEETDGVHHDFALGDLDGDGHAEFLASSFVPDYWNRSDTDSDLQIFDLHGSRLLRSLGTDVVAWESWGVALAQIDADPQLEYIHGIRQPPESSLDDGLAARDGSSHGLEWSLELEPTREAEILVIGDVDGDGQDELVVSVVERRLTGSGLEHADVRVIRLASGSERRRRTEDVEVTSILIGEFDGDPDPEVLLGSWDGIRVLHGPDLSDEGFIEADDVLALAEHDLDGDGGSEVLVGLGDGSILGLDLRSDAEVLRHAAGGPVTALTVGDLDQDGRQELLAIVKTPSVPRAVVAVYGLPDLERHWTSPEHHEATRRRAGLMVGDIDEDGRVEIVVGATHATHVYEYGSPGPDAQEPTLGAFAGLETVVAAGNAECCPWVDLSWSEARDDSSLPLTYRIHRGDRPDFAVGADSHLADTGATSFRDVDLDPNTEYTYLVRAVDAAGNAEGNDRRLSVLTPPDRPPEPAVLAVSDEDECAFEGLRISFDHPGSIHELRHELLSDGVVVASDVSSGSLYAPGDDRHHVYRLRTVYRACGLSATSNQQRRRDRTLTPLVAPRGFRITDPDPCRAGTLRVRFSHEGFDEVGRHELWRDGVLIVSSLGDGDEIATPDGAAHEYQIRSYDERCAQEVRTGFVSHADLSGCTNPLIRFDDAGGERWSCTWWNGWEAEAYNAYVGSLSSFWTAEAYDHEPSRPGVVFASSPTDSNGCDVSNGPAAEAVFEFAANGDALYLFITTVQATGEREYGADWSGVDRRDVAVDPRDGSFACP